MDIYIYVGDKYHTKHVEDFVESNEYLFHSVETSAAKSEAEARDEALHRCTLNKCDFFFR